MRIGVTIRLTLPLALLAGACGDETEPLDGGYPLELAMQPEEVESVAHDPCWRREKGGWHHSVGHCEQMGPQEEMTGVYVTGFEERSYFPATVSVPDPYDRRRFTIELEVDQAKLLRMAGPVPVDGYPAVFRIRFLGRRTRNPVISIAMEILISSSSPTGC